jgi:hypothetical protein
MVILRREVLRAAFGIRQPTVVYPSGARHRCLAERWCEISLIGGDPSAPCKTSSSRAGWRWSKTSTQAADKRACSCGRSAGPSFRFRMCGRG